MLLEQLCPLSFGSDALATCSSSRFPCLQSFDFSGEMVFFDEVSDFSCCSIREHLSQGKAKLPFYNP